MPVTVVSLYAIRQKSTGFYMPAPNGRQGRGGSHMEPCEMHGEYPRLFTTERAAKSALGLWLLGKFYGRKHEVMHAGDFMPEIEEYIDVVPQPNRSRDDMEIVAVRLELP